MSEKVTVSGTPSLLLSDGSTATYKGGSGSDTITFAYDSHGWHNSRAGVAGVVLPSSASITDAAGNEADLSGAKTATTASRGWQSISGKTELELFGPSRQLVSFARDAQGELQLDASSRFGGYVSGFGGRNAIDLADIDFGSRTTLAYEPNRWDTGGTLTVSDGTHAAKIALLGQYAASSFAMSASNSGGTVIHDAHSSAMAPTLTQPQHA